MLLLEEYQVRSLSYGSWKGVPSGMVQGKKLFLKVSEEVEICISFIEWCALVLVEAGVTKSAAGISTKPWVILYIMVTCDLALLDSSVSQLRSSSMSVTLLLFRYLFVAYLAARRWTISILSFAWSV